MADETMAGILRDLRASLDAQLAFAEQAAAVTSFVAVQAMADLLRDQLGDG